MNTFDLKEYAEHSLKLSSKNLTTTIHPNVEFRKRDVLATHLLDSIIIVQMFVFSNMMLKMTMKSFILSQMASKAYSTTGGLVLDGLLIATISLTYFATSYFFNQGQTVGMKLMGKRISMQSHSMTSALNWSLYSMGLFLSLGATMTKHHQKLKEQGHGSFVGQDHLYQDLMSYKTWGISVEIEPSSAAESADEDFKQAA